MRFCWDQEKKERTKKEESKQSQREISRFNYAKLSYELGYQDEALKSLRSFLNDYPNSVYNASELSETEVARGSKNDLATV